jgi:hypothetical protein
MQTNNISAEEFISLVFEMRESQKNWFRFHKKNFLEKSILLEIKVDEVLKTIDDKQVSTAQLKIEFE